MEDTPQVFQNQSGVPYIPNNYAGHWQGTVLAWRALARSLNIPAIKVLDTIGFDAAITRSAALLGITDQDEIDRTFPRLYPLALGVISVAPVQMAKAFAIFANQGRRVDPIAIRTVENRNGTIVMDPERDLRLDQRRRGNAMQVISPQNAYLMTSVLQKTITAGTLANASGSGSKFRFKNKKNGKYFSMPMAGKTGTTQNWSDAWTIGFSPYYTAAVWFGYDKGGQSLGLDNTGATLAGPPWANFMRAIHEDMPYKDFIRPETGLTYISVCSKSGMLQTPYCNEGTIALYFLSGTQPTKACTYHEANNVLLEIAKDRLRKSNYSTGQTPVDIIKTDVLLDPRIFEDPEPSKRRRTENTSYTDDPFITDEPIAPSGFDNILEADPSLSSGEDNSSIEQSPMLTPQQSGQDFIPQQGQQNTPNTVPQSDQTSGTQEADSTQQPPIPQTHLETIDEGTPLPSFPPVESEPANTESEKTEQDGTIQGEGVNPWL